MPVRKEYNIDVILKHNDLSSITKEGDSIDTIRFLNSCLSSYQGTLYKEDTYYPVDIEHYAKGSGISIGKALTEIIELATFYRETTIKIELANRSTWHTSLIYDFIVNSEDNTLVIQWNKKVIPLISGKMPKGTFSYYNRKMDYVPNKKRYLMYELLSSTLHTFAVTDVKRLSLLVIREALALEDTEYLEFRELNRRIIQPTVEDIYKILGVEISAKWSRKYKCLEVRRLRGL